MRKRALLDFSLVKSEVSRSTFFLAVVMLSCGCTTSRYDMATVEGQIACTFASTRVQERCVKRFLRRGGRIHGVQSDPTSFYDSSGFRGLGVQSPFYYSSALHLTSLLVTSSGADPRYIAGYCRDRAIPEGHGGEAKRLDACSCARICDEPALHAKFECGPWTEDVSGITRRLFGLDDSFPSCDFEPDEPGDWDRLKKSLPKSGDPPAFRGLEAALD